MKKTFIYLILVTLLSASCKPGFQIQSETITTKNLSRLSTFKFFNPDNMPASNFAFSDNNKKRIFDAVAEEMIQRGYSSTQQADLIIKIQGGTSHEIENNKPQYPYNNYYNNYYGGYSNYYNRDPWMYDDLSKKTTMIIIDIIDPETSTLLWQGTGSGVLSDKEALVEQNLRKAISDIFLQFPAPLK